MKKEKILNGMNIHEQNGLLKSSLGTICDGLFHLYYQWRTSIESKNVSEPEAIAQCIIQIVVCKIRTLISLCNGVSIMPENNSIKVLDIPSMISILRSLYEMAFVFHNIYAEQETEEERYIVLYIWEIRGLNNRQNLSNVRDLRDRRKTVRRQACITKWKSGFCPFPETRALPARQPLLSPLRWIPGSKNCPTSGPQYRRRLQTPSFTGMSSRQIVSSFFKWRSTTICSLSS